MADSVKPGSDEELAQNIVSGFFVHGTPEHPAFKDLKYGTYRQPEVGVDVEKVKNPSSKGPVPEADLAPVVLDETAGTETTVDGSVRQKPVSAKASKDLSGDK